MRDCAIIIIMKDGNKKVFFSDDFERIVKHIDCAGKDELIKISHFNGTTFINRNEVASIDITDDYDCDYDDYDDLEDDIYKNRNYDPEYDQDDEDNIFEDDDDEDDDD